MDARTIIIGGGMTGMSCALQLKAHNRDFLLIAGDHNSMGLEPACISGIHAANQIIRSSQQQLRISQSDFN